MTDGQNARYVTLVTYAERGRKHSKGAGRSKADYSQETAEIGKQWRRIIVCQRSDYRSILTRLPSNCLPTAAQAQPFPGADEVGKCFETHFLHHACAMHFDSVLTRAKIGSDLFVQMTGDNQGHNL